MVYVSQLLEEILEHPVKVGYEKRTRGKDSYFVSVQSCADLLKLGHAVEQFSITKVRQWKLVLEYTLSRIVGNGRRQPATEREMQIIAEMSTINKRWSENDKLPDGNVGRGPNP
jgi:hypothetical protein